MTASERDVRETATRARTASRDLARRSRADKDRALLAMADALGANAETILAANAQDVAAARAAGTAASIVDRLTLNPARLSAMADGLRQVAGLADPVGEVARGGVLPNGMELRQVRVPLGVIGMIYEARPNVTVDAAGLCLKSGNAALLRGSSSAYQSNSALVAVLREALVWVGLPADAVCLVPGTDHESVKHIMRMRGLVDVLVPRGGAGLIRTVVEESTVPVIETGVGNCHVYVDADADLDQALAIVLNAKTQKVSVCNAAETLLVHAGVAGVFLPRVLAAFAEAGVTVHGDERVRAVAPSALPATGEDWATEYLSMDMAVRVVDSLDEAVDHINRWGSQHTEAIVTRSLAAARAFVAGCDSAAVMVNASTRFTDGERFGFGAEIGISTQKLHARGPMGLRELTSTRWVAFGDGHLVT